jgi:hypothetical protein
VEIKDCPFCGSEGTIRDCSDWNYRLNTGERFDIGCSNKKCIAFYADMDAIYDTKYEAITEWNKRKEKDE